MKKSLRWGLAGLLAAATCSPAMAQSYFSQPTGYRAGDLLVHLSAIGVIPENIASSVSVSSKFHVKTSNSVSPEIDGSYFLTPNLSVQLIAASTRHNVWVTNGTAIVKAGAVWVLPPTITLQYHFPQIGDMRPYAGAGVTVAFFYAPKKAADVTKEGGFSTGVGPALDVGFDVPICGNWTGNFDLKQVFLVTGTHVDNGAVGAHTELDPTIVGAGVGYLF